MPVSPPDARSASLRVLDLTDRALLAGSLQEIEQLRKDLGAALRARAEAERVASAVAADNARLRHELCARQQLLDTLTADVAQARGALADLHRDLTRACAAEAERADHNAEALDEATQRLTAALNAANDHAREAHADRDAQIATLTEKHTTSLQAQRAELERAKTRAEAFKTERDEAREQALDQRRRCVQLERDLQQSSVLAADLQRRLDAQPVSAPQPTPAPSPPPQTPQHTTLSEIKATSTLSSSAPSLWLSARALDPLAERVALDERLRLVLLDLQARDQRIRSLELQLDQLRHRLRRLYPTAENPPP